MRSAFSPSRRLRKNRGVESAQETKGGAPMTTWSCSVHPTPERELQLKRLGDEIAELAAHVDAATARLLELIREFDARDGWGNGFRSCAEWLTWRIGLAPGAAREHVRVARALGALPRLAQALARGELSYSKVRAITRVATPETEERLLAVGRGGTAQHVERIVRAWRAVDRKAEVQETAQRHRARSLHVHQDEDGMVVIRGRLEPEAGAVLMQALGAARETLYQQGRRADIVPAGVLAGHVGRTKRSRGNADRTSRRRWHADMGPAAGGRARLARGDGAPPWNGAGSTGRALPGCHLCRRGRARRFRRAWPVGGRRHARFRRDSTTAGVRRQPRRHAARSRRPHHRGRRSNEDDSALVAPSARAPRWRLSLPRLRLTVWSGSSHSSLGSRRAHDAVESRDALSAPPSRRSRRGFSADARGQRGAHFPDARWSTVRCRPDAASDTSRRRR